MPSEVVDAGDGFWTVLHWLWVPLYGALAWFLSWSRRVDGELVRLKVKEAAQAKEHISLRSDLHDVCNKLDTVTTKLERIVGYMEGKNQSARGGNG